jgi:hypothetical protein
MNSRNLAAFGVCVVLAACAKPPEKIQAVAMDEGPYLALSCDQIKAQKSSYQSEYEVLAKQQQNTANADAVGVLVLGVPGGSLAGGDKETPIAVLKGKMAALNSVAVRKKCVA